MEELRRSRGQLILVAGITIAVVFITLGVITNAAIFTQNLASRGDTGGGANALSVRAGMASSTAETIELISDASGPADPDPNDLDDWVDSYDETLGYRAGVSSSVVQVTHDSQTSGFYFEDVDSSDPDGYSGFTSQSGTPDWDVLVGAQHVRDFSIEVDESELTSGSDELGDGTLGEFAVTFQNPSDPPFWRIQFGSSGPDVGVRVVRHNPSGPNPIHVGTCTRPGASPLVVNVTAATVNGVHCEPLAKVWDGPNEVGSTYFDGNVFKMRIENGDEAAGRYEFVTDGNDDGNTASGTADRGTDDPWHNSEAVYAATLEYRYNTSSAGFDDEIRVAPGEPDA